MNNQLIDQLDIYTDKNAITMAAVMGSNNRHEGDGDPLTVRSPIDGSVIGQLKMASEVQVEQAIAHAREAFLVLRTIPAPKRGEFIRELGNRFRKQKQLLAELITLECGKILQESLGEVQEVIDICDFAVGLSRQLHGLTIVSERPDHRMMEQWLPLGPVAVISAFNFPMAVWAWNAMLAIVCGDSVIWKPSEKTPLCALACQSIIDQTLKEFPEMPQALSQVVVGDHVVGAQLTHDTRIPLVSATGSVVMGKKVAQAVGSRLGRSLLELGGNNGMIVTPSADKELALRAIVFSAVGTCGQRCTSLRRLIVHDTITDDLLGRLVTTYSHLPIGDPMDATKLVGPLIDEQAFELMQIAMQQAKQAGGKLICGGEQVTIEGKEGGFYVAPAIIEINAEAAVIKRETFAPILYVIRYQDFSQAISIHNGVPQGLSSAIFTTDLQEAELFLSVVGSDCGLANVNIGTSGAEIGGAFGGEKETGGGRESGSDAWKNYMRRTTNTINYGNDIPLAQGITFG
ncbi:L-piperidine-6-carboxylate dehydrogenase [Sedimenticola selenatireducens]|uniref:Aldehyde dehydrogenase family protein n=1 Tax=Sedimenticola selenatireducens TaxID=191960 RepID=A0A557RZD8_9GAMM|nr:aldehyde dehydrogenase family protein [Sedimenticola selenatireducens]TVT63099.1 MAG: aldehyde dehydrogenase family protein [Sedimenticola selenatireducens]